MSVPPLRIRQANSHEARNDGRYVLVWMIAARRSTSNYALDRAVELATEHDCGVLVLEALRVGYPWASDRIHAFVLAGMEQNQRAFGPTPIAYYPYVEPKAGAGTGLIQALAADAVAVVTDEFPCFFLPRMVAAAAERLDVPLEVVDGVGLYPLRATERVFTTAHSFRAHLQKELPTWLAESPLEFAWEGQTLPSVEVSKDVLERWPAPTSFAVESLASLPIDHDVRVSEVLLGGPEPAHDRVERFVVDALASYGADRNHPDRDGSSGLSPYLHFGHVGAHEVVGAVLEHSGWKPAKLGSKTGGARQGWWGLPESVESFLDEMITWRELGPNFGYHRPAEYDQFDSLPDFARATLEEHAGDRREHLYSLADLEHANTHDDLWNAAQTQLVQEGRMHNYLRMLWGKNVLSWSKTPSEALERLIHLNNKYALDGRNPNSYSGIFWVFGRYDRAWGPEREVFGKVRYMTSANTKKKLKLADYMARFGEKTLFS